MLSRRRFLTGAVATLTAAATADLLLGERKIFLPPRGGWFHRRVVCDSALDGQMWSFGLAPVKGEGDLIAYDGIGLRSHPRHSELQRQAFAKSLNEHFRKAYAGELRDETGDQLILPIDWQNFYGAHRNGV